MIFVLSSSYLRNEDLTAARAFTALAIIELLTNPLSKVLTSIPSFTASMGCVERIQKYIHINDWTDGRTGPDSSPLNTSSDTSDGQSAIDWSEKVGSSPISARPESGDVCPNFELASFAHTLDALPTLNGIHIEVHVGSLTMVIGPVGCGRSSFSRVLLGRCSSRPVRYTSTISGLHTVNNLHGYPMALSEILFSVELCTTQGGTVKYCGLVPL